MNILLLEDSGSILIPLQRLLQKEKHEVFATDSIYSAQDYLDSYLSDDGIDCIIVDLNMNPDGLESDLVKTEYGLFAGWVWLCEKVLKKKPGLRRQTIVFSAYVGELEKMLKGKNEEEYFKDVYRIEKGGLDDITGKLLECIKEIETGKRGNR